MLGITTEILFEKFEILEVLKKDEHAAVFLANHVYLSKKIILKVLNTQKISDHALVERFKREAKLLAKLDHPNIIKVLDFGTAKEYFYISFEYIDGVSLRNIFKTKSLEPDQKEKLMVQLLKALDFAHAHQIIHRDIKPENIFIDKNLNLKLGDFGLALSAEDNFVTNPYSIVGTPSYMSPEQVRGAKLNPQSDLFSAGVVLFEMFTGRNPFLKENVSLTLNEIMGFDEGNISNQVKDLPEQIGNLLSKLLQKNLSKRYDSAREILNELNIPDEQPTMTVEQYERESGRSKKLLWLMAIVSVVAILIIIMMKLENPGVESNLNPENKEISNSTDTAGRNNSESGINRDEINQDEVNPANLNKPLVEQGNNKMDQDQSQNVPVVKYGQLLVNVSPYAEVFIDGERIGLTPFTKPLVYQEGEHTIKLVHPDYPVFSDVVNVIQGETTRFRVSLESTIGYIRCRVAPWGNVYVNEDFKGTTPLPEKELIRVAPGPVRLVIKHPSYKDIDTAFTISRGDTLNFRFTFKK
ncbi:MAG TPA: serine/threonine-protein kinase [Melioribacteraceae bacterium]|nr:serine/threonine-protein kinase [Melioribacteraceae bacterium]